MRLARVARDGEHPVVTYRGNEAEAFQSACCAGTALGWPWRRRPSTPWFGVAGAYDCSPATRVSVRPSAPDRAPPGPGPYSTAARVSVRPSARPTLWASSMTDRLRSLMRASVRAAESLILFSSFSSSLANRLSRFSNRFSSPANRSSSRPSSCLKSARPAAVEVERDRDGQADETDDRLFHGCSPPILATRLGCCGACGPWGSGSAARAALEARNAL